MDRAYERQYDEERYLFEVVHLRFQEQGWLDAYDLMSIVRWKANRAISTVAKGLIRRSSGSLNQAARELTSAVFKAKSDEERFLILSEKWKVRLPMASAILTVLFPDRFTVYDVRACEMVGGFGNLANRANALDRWKGYLEFKAAVEKAAPSHLSLRDKDRYLWARSRHESLEQFLRRDFSV